MEKCRLHDLILFSEHQKFRKLFFILLEVIHQTLDALRVIAVIIEQSILELLEHLFF